MWSRPGEGGQSSFSREGICELVQQARYPRPAARPNHRAAWERGLNVGSHV